MTKINKLNRATLGTALAAVLAAGMAATAPAPAHAQSTATAPSDDVALSVGSGKMVRLNGTMSDLFVANDAIADVQVRSTNQIYIFGKSAGETTLYATNRAGKVIYSANVRVGQNLGSINDLLDTAMPGSQVRATPMNGVVLLTGTVAAPEDVEEAGRIVQAYVGDGTKVISRIKSATPLTVMLQVKIAEVNRGLLKNLGVNLLAGAGDNGFNFAIGQGEGIDLDTGEATIPSTGSVLRFGGRLLGLDFITALQLAEDNNMATTLAEPSLTALSGETASFLAGGEFPIPVSQSLGAISIEYKNYGVGLAFTPTVLEDGRISMRVRPEVSEISNENSINLNGYNVPALTTRRAETTIELGSGQSFMIAGLLRNTQTNSVEKAPWLGDLPILGALFRSTNFRRAETELVIVVTPYLVKPVSANRIALPTDGFRTANDVERQLLDKAHSGISGAARHGPVMAPPQTVAPAIGAIGGAALAAPVPARPAAKATASKSPAPGFTF